MPYSLRSAGGTFAPRTRRMVSGWQSDLIEGRDELLISLGDDTALMRRLHGGVSAEVSIIAKPMGSRCPGKMPG